MERSDIVETLSQLALFADLTRPQLEAVVHTFDEVVFADGQRVLRKGLAGDGVYIILEGTAGIVIEGEERTRLGRGEFFGEISALTGETPSNDVIAAGLLRCVVIPTGQLEPFLLERPQVMLRMLKTEARRLAATIAWLD